MQRIENRMTSFDLLGGGGGWGKPLAGSYVPLALKRAKYLAIRSIKAVNFNY